MRLSELRPCDSCGGELLPKDSHIGTFYLVRSSLVVPNPEAGRQLLGLHTMFGGGPDWSPRALALAETFAPDADAFIVVGDKEPELMTEAFICFDCYTSKPLYQIVERANEAAEKWKSLG